VFLHCRPPGFPPRNVQRGILGPPPAMPRHVAARFMRMRLVPPVTFPFADMQRFRFNPSMMQLPTIDAAETLNGNERKQVARVIVKHCRQAQIIQSYLPGGAHVFHN